MEELKTCHQCRQRTTNPMAICKNVKDGTRPCPLKFCQRCLWNRYEEKFEEVDQLNSWNCPKCRGKCNCSVCLKWKGKQPTGKFAKTTKAEGSSVSKLVDEKGEEYLQPIGVGNNDVATTTLEKETVIVQSGKQGNASNKVPKEKRKAKNKERKWATNFDSLKPFLDDKNEKANKGMEENMAKRSKIQKESSTLKDDTAENPQTTDDDNKANM